MLGIIDTLCPGVLYSKFYGLWRTAEALVESEASKP